MKITVLCDRIAGPIIGSRLVREYALTEPEVDELRLPPAGESMESYALRQEALRRRQRFIDAMTATFAREFALAIEEALDRENPRS